jgi:ribosomal protein S18 acetylase RimI-like enzyme
MREVTVRILADRDRALLADPEPGVFDRATDPGLVETFIHDPRHHLAAAIEGGRIVGFVSAVDYVHPDKPRQLFINEVGVVRRLHRRGVGLALMRAMLSHGRAIGCTEAWVATDLDNRAARGLYRAAGGAEETPDKVLVTFALDADPGGA